MVVLLIPGLIANKLTNKLLHYVYPLFFVLGCQVEGWECNSNYGDELTPKNNVRNSGLCMIECRNEPKCTYWQYKKPTKECILLGQCGTVQNGWSWMSNGIDGPRREISAQKGWWIMGAKKCQTIQDTKDDRGKNSSQ